MDILVGKTFSHYRVIERIGAGGMGEVYRARDVRLERDVALKVLPAGTLTDESARKRFRKEALALSKLNHPNIATIHDFDSQEGVDFLVMEHVTGETLGEKLQGGPLAEKEIARLGVELAEGLAAAHGQGVIHRDLKPGNLRLTPDGRLKILDFGLAKLVRPARATDLTDLVTQSASLTEMGAAVGTLPYMAPEQLRGDRVDARADLWAAGLVLYELASGRRAFPEGERAELITAILRDVPPPPSGLNRRISPRLDGIIAKCLEKDPESRYQSAKELAVDLRRLGGPAHSPSHASVVRKKRFRIATASAVLAAAIATALGLWSIFGRGGKVQAAEPRLAIMYFENVAEPADSERLGEIATNLLITDLSEVQYVTVVSTQRLYDILKNIGKEGLKVINRDTATEVARKAGANRMLVGSILRSGGSLELTSQLIDVTSGASRASQRIRGTEGEDIFALVDQLAAEVRKDLDLGGVIQREVKVADITTRSTEAYRYYLDGNEFVSKEKFLKARLAFQKAVEADSTFAMAWVALARPWMADHAGSTREETEKAMAMAVAHSRRATRTEARYIAAWAREFADDHKGAISDLETLSREFPDEKRYYFDLAHLFMRASPARSIAFFEKVIALDPMDAHSYDDMVSMYRRIGDRERSIWAINKYVHLVGDDANAYNTRGYLYGLDGQIDRAIESYRKSVDLDSTFGGSWVRLGLAYVVTRDEARAQDCWDRALALDVSTRGAARYLRAAIPVYHGNWEEAVEAYQEAVTADQREDATEVWSFKWKHFQIGALYAEKRDWPRAVAAFQRAREVSHSQIPEIVGLSIVHLASGEPSLVENELQRLRTLDAPVMYSIARAWVEMARGRYDQAVAAIDSTSDFSFEFWVMYTKGVAYLRVGRGKESIEKLEHCRDVFNAWKNDLPQVAVRVHYLLGQAYEAAGEQVKAIGEYEKFIGYWKDADLVFIGDVDDARRRLSRLRT